MKRSVWVSVAVFSLLCSLWVPSALGQAVYGSILGTVTDPSGAAVSRSKSHRHQPDQKCVHRNHHERKRQLCGDPLDPRRLFSPD